MDDSNDSKQQVIDSLKQANNILVTVKNSPTIDQLAACIGLTLILNDQGKHGTAVFSGEVPSVLEFLEPGKTLERNADSLQDFIISLDKSKADKLRYKVEDSVVRIFITPYKTSITEKDLDFGQGDFNVDVVVALGVHNQDDLDQAITSHGRILHDATVISMNTEPGGSDDLGSINWLDADCSSLSEMVVGIADSLAKESKDDKDDRDDKKDVIDNQIATALLTGIVAETERFGNAKTTPATMETAAKLLTAGANQELVATKLGEPYKHEESKPEEPENPDSHDEPKDEPKDDSHDAPHDEPSGTNHPDIPKSIYEESSDGSGNAPMPSLLQSDDESDSKSTEEAEEDKTEATIDHSDDDEDEGGVATTDLTDPTKPGDGSLDIDHPNSGDATDIPVGQEAQLGDHHDDLAAGLTEPMAASSSESSKDDSKEGGKEDDDLALAHAGIDMPHPLDASPASPDVKPDTDSLTPPLTPAIASPVIEPTAQSPVSEAKNADQADLDMVKQHNPDPSKPSIQPIHATHGMYIAPPTHDAAESTPSDSDVEAPSGGSPYGLTPPVMGGTLTSNNTDDHAGDPMSSGASGSISNQPATLTHSQPDFGKLTPPLESAPPTTLAGLTASMTPTPAAAATTAAPSAPTGPLVAPLVENNQPSSQPAQDSGPQAPTMDMPAPALTPMLTLTPPSEPQAAAPAAPSASAPLPPTPPPLTPSLIPPLTPPAAI